MEAAEEIPLIRLSDNQKNSFLSPSGGGEDEGEGVPRDWKPFSLTLSPARGEENWMWAIVCEKVLGSRVKGGLQQVTKYLR